MLNEELPDHIVYSPAVIDFVTVAAETCLFLENTSSIGRDEFVDKAVKILALLYLKTTLLTAPEPVFDDGAERFVTEEDYMFVKEQIEQLLGADDSYLEVFHPDMALSDTPIAAFVSENVADIYQEIKDFASNYRTADNDVMNDALVVCIEAFAAHWGQKLLNALRALHALRYAENFGVEMEDATQTGAKLNRNTFLDFLHDDNQNEYGDLLD